MPLDKNPRDLPVLLLYNLDPSWTRADQEEVTKISLQLKQTMSAVGHPVELVPLGHADLPAVLDSYDRLSHVVLNWCEGIPGVAQSEWLVAHVLESLDFAFTGASSETLAFAQDKRRAKEVLAQSGIPTPQWRVYDVPVADAWNQFPAIVKPANTHCSEGVTRESVVMTEKELLDRVSWVLETYKQPALVEDFIDGREFHISLWGNGHIEMLPPVEMDFSLFSEIQDRLCTYDAKFVPGSPHYEGIQTLLPAPLNQDELQAVETVCKAAYTAIECRDYGRIDLRVRDGVYYVLDVNPNADISADASLACAAEVAGYSYGEAGSRIVRLAARRHPVWGKEEP